MGRQVVVKYAPLHSSLVNLPLSLYGPLVSGGVRPQSIAIYLSNGQQGDGLKSAYLGWTGLASAASAARWTEPSRDTAPLDVLEIDPQLAVSLGFIQGDALEIGIEKNISVAKSVCADPISSDDWEILELHAQYLEDNLLSQVRVASVGQEINVWIMGKTRIRFRVSALDPTARVCLLTSDTEVIVAPKSRKKSDTNPTEVDKPEATGPLACVVRVLPTRLFPEPPTMRDDPTVFVSTTTMDKLATKSLKEVYVTSINVPFKTLLESLKNSTQSTSTPTNNLSLKNLREVTEPAPVVNGKEEKPDPVAVLPLPVLPPNTALVANLSQVHVWGFIRLSSTPPETKFASSNLDNTIPFLLPASTPTPNLASVDKIIAECETYFLQGRMIPQQSQTQASRLLLCGGRGSGKTSIAITVAKRLERNPKVFACPIYIDMNRYVEERLAGLRALFSIFRRIAIWCKPCLLILDNLDKLLTVEIEHTDSFRSRQISELFANTLRQMDPACSILATCEGPTSVHPLVISSHLFSQRVTIKSPNKDARAEILQHIVQLITSTDESVHGVHPLNYISLATQTEGYSATDLQDLIKRALHVAMIRAADEKSPIPFLSMADFEEAQRDFSPLSIRDVKLQKSEVEWSDIGGLHYVRKILRETLEWPTKYAAIFAKCPLRLRSGLLLYGYPGCGKTLMASAVAKECGLNFISVKGPELLNKYIGASEKSIRELFERASSAKPCVLFFDEFDAIAPRRGHDSTGVTDRVVNQMLTQMDGAEGLDGVYVLAATSRPDLIDPALLRPGRLDKSLLCHMPDANERVEILTALSRKMELEPSVDLSTLGPLTRGFSGADLQALLYNAHLESVHSVLERSETTATSGNSDNSPIRFVVLGSNADNFSRAEQSALNARIQQIMRGTQPTTKVDAQSQKVRISMDNIWKALEATRPSVALEERERLERIYNDFASDRSTGLPVPPNSDVKSIGNRTSLM